MSTRSKRWILAIVTVSVAFLVSCLREPHSLNTPTQPAVDTPQVLFWDATDESGLSAIYENGGNANRYSILEVMGGGCAVLDYDGDGLLDLFFPCGGQFTGPGHNTIIGMPPKLYRNLGAFRFQDVTADGGLMTLAEGKPWFYSHGAMACDYDNDGWPDLLMTGYGRVALWHNEPSDHGGRRFREVTKDAGLLGPHIWAIGAAWGDLDGDGFADLYVCDYLDWSIENDPHCPGYRTNIPRDICPPRQFASRPHRLYRNRGDGTFENVTAAAGIRTHRPDKVYGKGLGCLIADLNGDGKPDLYVTNDGEDNFMYLNKSVPGSLRFEENGLELGVARDSVGMPNGSMGIDISDVDGTGLPSLWVTNYENEAHALYRPQPGRKYFYHHVSSQYGLTEIGTKFVGFGTAFIDVDDDGWEDIVIANGHVIRHSPSNNIRQRPILFRNIPNGDKRRFVDSKQDGGSFFRELRLGRGVAVADLDNDGRPDLVFCHINEPARVLKNIAPEQHWLGITLASRDRRDVTGAKLILEVGDLKRHRYVTGGRSYASSCDTRVIFGLGSQESVDRLVVQWPSGTPRQESWRNLPIDLYHAITQGSGLPEK